MGSNRQSPPESCSHAFPTSINARLLPVATPSHCRTTGRLPPPPPQSIYHRSSQLPPKVPGRLRRWPLGRHVGLGHASIDDKVGAVDEAALVGREEEHRLRLLNRLAEAAGWKVHFAAVALGGVVAEPVLEEGSAGSRLVRERSDTKMDAIMGVE